MTSDQIGALVTSLAVNGLALWRAMHADKVASRVEARTEASSDATDERLKGGAKAFAEIRSQNTAQAERIAENQALIQALELRVTTLERQLREAVLAMGGKPSDRRP